MWRVTSSINSRFSVHVVLLICCDWRYCLRSLTRKAPTSEMSRGHCDNTMHLLHFLVPPMPVFMQELQKTRWQLAQVLRLFRSENLTLHWSQLAISALDDAMSGATFGEHLHTSLHHHETGPPQLPPPPSITRSLLAHHNIPQFGRHNVFSSLTNVFLKPPITCKI